MPTKTLPSLRAGNRPGFLTSDDIYADTSMWTEDDLDMCYRYITRLVGRASTRKRYANNLRAVRFDKLSDEVLAMFKKALSEATMAYGKLSDEQKRTLDEN